MQKQIKIHKTILAEETELGEGAILLLDEATSPIIRLLQRSYQEDQDCISGDIKTLFEIRSNLE